MQKKLLIKLGSKCNLHCSHCHCEQSSYKFNIDIINWIKKYNPNQITFAGGEPTVYFKQIKLLVNLLKNSFTYRLVTNGTTLTDEMCNFFNKNNFMICYSFDGLKTNRDTSIPIKWSLISKLNKAYPICCFNKQQNFEEVTLDLVKIRKNLNLNFEIPYFIPGSFIHTLDKNSFVSIQDVKNYINSYQKALDELFCLYMQGYSILFSELFFNAINNWWKVKNYTYGCNCFNPYKINLTLDGNFLLCPYKTKIIGNIYSGIIWDDCKLPTKCLNCSIKNICKNACIVNITENECIISKEMNKYLNQKINELGIKDKILKDLEEIS